MIQAIESIRRSIVVPAPPERAFAVFTSGMTAWWPSAHHIGSAPIAEIIIEPFAGGRWYTRHEDGSETYTGFVVAFEPPSRLVITWQIGADWKYDPALVTTVEVTVRGRGVGGTRVSLEHRDLDRFGPEAERMRMTFNEPGAWTGTLRHSRGRSRLRYVLLYASADDVAARAPEHFPAHFERIKAFHARGELLLVGTFGTRRRGVDGRLRFTGGGILRRGRPVRIERRGSSYEIREWNEILAAH